MDAVALGGLEGKGLPKVLQNFVDDTADLQTSAFVAAYACTAHFVRSSDNKQEKVNKVQVQSVVPFKKFIQSYRDYLNSLQLWNVRADFDVS